MIDIHSHILPDVDDGASSLTESLAMAKKAADEGIRKIVATPHHENGSYVNTKNQVIAAVDYLNGQLQLENIPVEILPGQETRIYGEMLQDLQAGKVLPVNDNNYVLVELPTSHVPQYTTQLLFDMQLAGYKPIIVHPERNHEIMEQPDKLYRMVKNGALTQVTAASLVGRSGKKVEKFANQLLEANLAHLLASDAHDTKKRGFYLKVAYKKVKSDYGSDYMFQLMDNAEAVITGSAAEREIPERVQKKRKWLVFR
ncbi:tyrosine-protein phosphatase [Virgibacillus xinjiangensis]|uniref:Tyrosine-protein phosphatase n=1 Tax=Virgibacillus xinjiangensis TaxID=393090 RepID=A0ABV7CUT2_9BACI